MREREVLELFRLHRINRDFSAAADVMRTWAQSTGKWNNLWHANIVLLLFALDMGLDEEAEFCIQQLEKLDADDPFLLSLTSQLRQKMGKHDEAIAYAKRAFENAELNDDPGLDIYREDLEKLRQQVRLP